MSAFIFIGYPDLPVLGHTWTFLGKHFL